MENYEKNDLLLIFKLSNFINQMTKELSNVLLFLVLSANKNFYVKFVAPEPTSVVQPCRLSPQVAKVNFYLATRGWHS
jgi:hypothetical protein